MMSLSKLITVVIFTTLVSSYPVSSISVRTKTSNKQLIPSFFRAVDTIPTISRQNNGLTGDICTVNSACSTDGTTRNCFDLQKLEQEQVVACSASSSRCFCFGFLPCTPNSSCPKGEVCHPFNSINMCVSQYLANSEEDSDSSGDSTDTNNDTSLSEAKIGVEDFALAAGKTESFKPAKKCVAIHHLSNFHSHQLVFDKHYRSQVLCDLHENCATPGHIVKYKESPMMMSTYCEIVPDGCQARIMAVNSPKYQRALEVASHHSDLVFTSFAARYETQMEEMLLSTAVKMGL